MRVIVSIIWRNYSIKPNADALGTVARIALYLLAFICLLLCLPAFVCLLIFACSCFACFCSHALH